MPRMRCLLPIVNSLFLFAACTTPEPPPPPRPVAAVAAPVAVKPVPKVEPKAPPKGGPECPVRSTVCTMEYNPTVCSAPSYAGIAQVPAEQLMAWGGNACAGRLNLNKLACEKHLLPSKLGGVQCVPDSSNGHCPPKPADCAVAMAKPAVCTAFVYGSQQLSADLAVRSTGPTECEAKAKLSAEACRRNLDPLKLSGISCTAALPPASAPGAQGAVK